MQAKRGAIYNCDLYVSQVRGDKVTKGARHLLSCLGSHEKGQYLLGTVFFRASPFERTLLYMVIICLYGYTV